ncbi:MAG TPA: DNA internalization-related competence protein ComEC/Rec2 [Bryobacteraceae bacterium]|nr:DNA internalization-related competence protein ComEC/Rec2 [Bryobacteraceae bacterium]
MKNPLILPLLALAAGIFAGHVLALDLPRLAVALAASVILTLLARWRARRLAVAGCLLVATLAGAMIEAAHRPGRPPELDAGAREVVLLNGCVVSPPAFYEGRDQFAVELAPKARAQVSMIVRDGDTPPDLHYGQMVEFEARIRPTRNFQNPGAFDYQAYLARSYIYWTASIPAGARLSVVPGRCGSRFSAAIFALRTTALLRIERLYAGNPYATGMMEATLIGETRKLEGIWTDHFRRTGTYHMLVIDGLHITVLAAFLLFLLRLCFVPELEALAVTAAGAWLYALVSGWNAPAVRAAGGFTLYVIARYFFRRGRFLNLLAAAAIVYLIADPAQLFESGFQLSFLAVAAIGALAVPMLDGTSAPYSRALYGIAEPSRAPGLQPLGAQFRLELRLLAETLHAYLRIPETWLLHALAAIARVLFYAYEIAVISTAIQIGVALPMALYFHRISLTGLAANILVVPLLALVVPAGFVAIFTGWHLPAALAAWLLKAGENVADWHLRFEPDWRVPDPPLWLSLALACAVLLLAWAMRRSRRLAWTCAVPVLALFALVYLHPFPPNVHPRQLELTVIDVGQGDSLLVSFPDSKLMLIDGGGILSFGRKVKPRFDIGEDVVSPYLWTRSIRKLDVVVLTHAHDDHARGLPAVIENFHPAELWTGSTPASEAWSQVRAKAQSERVRILAMQSGRSFDFGGARVEVLSPPPDYIAADTPKNNDSLALRITYGQRSFLLTGDMEKPMEQRLLISGEPVRADVLKVGHHGSNTSSTDPFLDAVAPVFAVISDGFANSFHHPHPQVLARLAAHRVGVFRTDQQGLITIRTDGRRMFVETYQPGQAAQRAYALGAASPDL